MFLFGLLVLGIALYLVYEWIVRGKWVSGIAGRYIFITGCDTGFGHELAKHLDLLGCRVFAGCLTSDGGKQLRDKCSERLTTVELDITSTESVRKAAEFVKSRIPESAGLWGLVNNAGVGGAVAGPFEWHTKEDFQKVLDVNLLGMVDVVLAFLPQVKKTKGRIVNMSSAAGRLAGGVNAPYPVSKYGVEVFSDSIRQELSVTGIKVSALEPGFFNTPIMSENNLRKLVQLGWDRLSPEEKDEYGHQYVDRSLRHMSKFRDTVAAMDIKPVIEAYTHALLGKYPKKRYSCGLDCKFCLVPLSYMPSFIQDWIMVGVMKKTLPRKKRSSTQTPDS